MASSTIATALLVKLLVLSFATCQGADGSPERCRSVLVALSGRNSFEVAVFCRAKLSTDGCQRALRELGPQPWTPERIRSTCSTWGSTWVPQFAQTRSLEESAEGKIYELLSGRSPWQRRDGGVDGFQVQHHGAPVVMPVGDVEPRIPQHFVKHHPVLPGNISKTAVLGTLSMFCDNLEALSTDESAEAAIRAVVTQTAKVSRSRLRIDSVLLSPDVIPTSPSGHFQVFFTIQTATKEEADKIEQYFASMSTREMSFNLWHGMTAHGANKLTTMVTGLDTRVVSGMETSRTAKFQVAQPVLTKAEIRESVQVSFVFVGTAMSVMLAFLAVIHVRRRVLELDGPTIHRSPSQTRELKVDSCGRVGFSGTTRPSYWRMSQDDLRPEE